MAKGRILKGISSLNLSIIVAIVDDVAVYVVDFVAF